MGSNGPERRSTGMGSPRSTEEKFTAPTPGLENMFFGRGNEFKDVVRELARPMASQDSTGAMAAAMVKNLYLRNHSDQRCVIPLNTW